MGKRRLARENALQALYLTDVSKLSAEDAFGAVSLRPGDWDEKTSDFSKSLALGAASNRKEIDEQIQSVAQNWTVNRMSAIDRSILRLASFELLHSDLPPGVIIDEALEIAKKYSSQESSRFINGILDKIKAHRPIKSPEKA